MGERLDPTDLEFYAEHFDFYNPRETALRERAVEELSAKCPITHSDAMGGFWLINQYDAVRQVSLDWESFSNSPRKYLTTVAPPSNRPAMPPLDIDPPKQRIYRQILNPYLTPKWISRFEAGIRAMVTELIDDFIEDGCCDLAEQFARPFPGRMLYRFLFGIDDGEVARVQRWTYQMTFERGNPDNVEVQTMWNNWCYELVNTRRESEHQEDIIDGLLHATIAGVPLTDEEIVGCLQILILGGFSTTTDSMLNTMLRLANDKALQSFLRSNPDQIATSLDEFFRIDSPVSGLPRMCTRDTVVNGQKVRAGERVFMFYHAANRDPEEFDKPNELILDRERNRHLAFGMGNHRCVGSNVARMNLRIAIEELLSRLGEFALTSGETAVYRPTGTWGPTRLPLTFTPSLRQSGSAVK
jgi:cytochrome P450